ASPVLRLATTPADPRVLPKDSDGLAAFKALRRAHFGPEIDIALAAPRGTLLDPGRLAAIGNLERQIGKLPLIRAVTGPGLIADATAEVGGAPKLIAGSRREVTSAETELTSRSRQLRSAQREARRQAADVSRGLARAHRLLASGRGMLAAASSRTGDVKRLKLGLTAAQAGVVGSGGLQVTAAQAGSYPGLDAALAGELSRAELAGRQVDAAERQAGQFADAMNQIADGAGRLVDPGLSTLAGGQQELAAALGQARDGVAAVQPQLDELAGGAQSLLSTGGELLETR